jgi:hypothetical protein
LRARSPTHPLPRREKTRDPAYLGAVTVKAVEANLTRIYAKLGIRSRTELASSLVDKTQLRTASMERRNCGRPRPPV